MTLALFGIIWSLVELPFSLELFVAYGSVLGFILIWLGITVASATAASKVLPIAGAGFSANVTTEFAVKVMIRIGSLLSLTACALLVFGLLPIIR